MGLLLIGPFDYSADISRTFHCGPGKPDKRQKQLYQMAMEEVDYNIGLIRPGISFSELQSQAYQVPEEFHHNAYSCIIHGIGMCDEYPNLGPGFRGALQYDGKLEAGMVVCVESYMGAVGERDGVKLEQQVMVTDDGHEILTSFPLEDAMLE